MWQKVLLKKQYYYISYIGIPIKAVLFLHGVDRVDITKTILLYLTVLGDHATNRG